jgi:signal transduction histidine kinase
LNLQRLFDSWTGIGAVAALSVLFAILFQFLRGFTQKWVDRLFYRGTYDYRQTLLTFNQRMRSILNLNELAENMLYPIVKALHTKQVVFLLPDTDSGDFAARFVQPAEAEELAWALRIRSDSPIAAWLLTHGTALDSEHIDVLPQFKSLWEPEREDIESLELELFCPLRRKDTLVGILALSKKRSETSYSGEDIDLLTTMANEAAVVIENAMMFDNLREQQLRVEQLLVRTVQAQEEERRRISIELHDGVAQWLVGANYQLQSCQAILEKGDLSTAKEDIGKLETTLDKSLKEIRSVIAGLRPPALEELGLVHAVNQAVKEFNNNGIVCKFETFGEPVRLSPSTELTIYRVVQESLNNVRKHSEATSVIVKLKFTNDKAFIEVNDNGKGFDYSSTMRQATSTGHMGLLGMRERASMLGGDLKIMAKVGSGVRINLTLPITSPEG